MNITFKDNDQIAVDEEIKNIVLVKNDKKVIKKLLSNIDNYIIVSYKEENYYVMNYWMKQNWVKIIYKKK